MDTQYPAASRTGPPAFFVPDKLPDAEFPDVFKIINHTHAILRSVPPIQVHQSVAGILFTTVAVLEATVRQCRTSLDPALDA